MGEKTLFVYKKYLNIVIQNTHKLRRKRKFKPA